MRSALIIVHDFPPMGGGGVMRTLKFTKYLPEFGWLPIILTVKPEHYPAGLLDETLEREIHPAALVERTGTWMKPYSLAPAEARGAPGSKGPMRSVLERVVPSGVRVTQDHGFFWLPPALARARRILRRQRIDLIFTTSPPHNVHLLGGLLKRLSGLPWIADFRDGWTRTEMYTARSAWRHKFDQACERWVVRGVDRLVCVTPPIAEDFYLDHPGARGKTHVIYNGYDPEDFQVPLEPRAEPPLFRVLHMGALSMNPHRTPELLFQAAGSLARKDPEFKEKFRLDLIGPVVQLAIEPMLREHGLESNCSVPGLLPHREALQSMRRASVLLLLINYRQKFGDAGILPGKFGEYVAAGKPILALAREGVAADLIRRHGLGPVLDPDDAEGLERQLAELFQRWKAGRLDLEKNQELLELFDRKSSTERLARLFTQAAGGEARA